MAATLSNVLFGLAALAYAWASALFATYLFGKESAVGSRLAWAPRLLAIGAWIHAAHIVLSSLVLRVCPVKGMHFSMSVVSVFACAAYAFGRRRFKMDVVGAFVAPLALTFLIASQVVALRGEPSARVFGAILPLHIAANLLGDALFLLAFAAAVLYLVQEKRLKNKQFVGMTKRLPPLDALDLAELRFLLVGFPLMTIGILTGTIFARRVEFGSALDQARAAFGYLTWLVFALVLLLRMVAGWRGKKAAYGTIVGFGIAMVVLLLYVMRSLGAPPSASGMAP